MEYVLPFVAFLLFLGLIRVQTRRQGSSYRDIPVPTPEQKRVARVFQVAMLVPFGFLMAAVIGGDELLPLLVPAGLGFIAGGMAFQLDAWGLRDALTRVDAQSFTSRAFGTRSVTPWWGIAGIVVGTGFLATGVAAVI